MGNHRKNAVEISNCHRTTSSSVLIYGNFSINNNGATELSANKEGYTGYYPVRNGKVAE